jgi:hypothetical protein
VLVATFAKSGTNSMIQIAQQIAWRAATSSDAPATTGAMASLVS